MTTKALSFLLLAAITIAGTGCVRETPLPPKSAGVVSLMDGTESPDHLWCLAKVKRSSVVLKSGREAPRGPAIALLECGSGKRVFDFTNFDSRLTGTREFALNGAFAQPPAWSPDSSKLAIAFHKWYNEDFYVLRRAKGGWREVALPPHHLLRDLHAVPGVRESNRAWSSEQVTKVKWAGPDELHVTCTVWFSPYEGCVTYAYNFQSGRVSSRVLKAWVEPGDASHR